MDRESSSSSSTNSSELGANLLAQNHVDGARSHNSENGRGAASSGSGIRVGNEDTRVQDDERPHPPGDRRRRRSSRAWS